MNIELNIIKLLREKTGAGITSCKKALLEAEGNLDKAILLLREKGLAVAEKKLERHTTQGVIASYIHTGSKMGALLELNCETDFVARKIEFQNLAQDLAMQIVATDNLKYISLSDIPQDIWDLESQNAHEQLQREGFLKPFAESLIQMKIKDSLEMYTLLSQPYIKDTSLTV